VFGGISLVERAPCSSDREHETKDAGYDPRADIAPVCLAVDFSNVLVAHPGVPAPTLAEYLALARLPEGMDYGTAGGVRRGARDPDLGEVRVTRLTGAYAAGRVLNPLLARSQHAASSGASSSRSTRPRSWPRGSAASSTTASPTT
jgi:hypothetical protein